MQDVASQSSEDAAYVECWPDDGQATYADLKSVIDNANQYSSGTKSTILAAYMDSTYANNFSSTNPGQFNAPGVLLTDATIFASGGDHIEIGDGLNMLNAPYFPNHNLVMSTSLQSQLQNYYNFMVAYENLLRGGLTNTSNLVTINGLATSTNATPGKVWEFTKSGKGYDVIHLINLLNQTSNQWNDTNANYPTPTTQNNVTVKYYYGTSTVNSAAFASPDYQNGKSYDLSYTSGSDSNGNYISFTIPSLQYWDMVYVSKS